MPEKKKTKKPVKKLKKLPGSRKPSQIKRDHALITKYYLTGHSQAAISDVMRTQHNIIISQPTISRDLNIIQERWVKDTSIDIDQQKVIELQKLDRLEQEFWKAWRNSVGEKQKRKQKTRAAKDPAERAKYGATLIDQTIDEWWESGDPRFLFGILDCIQKRCKIFGIEAVGDTNITIGQQTFAQFVNNYIHKE